MVDDGALAAAGHHDHLLDPARDRLLDAVLDGRLVDQGQHFLRLCLRHRQETGAQTGRPKNPLAQQTRRHQRQSIWWTPWKASRPAPREGPKVSWSMTRRTPTTAG